MMFHSLHHYLRVKATALSLAPHCQPLPHPHPTAPFSCFYFSLSKSYPQSKVRLTFGKHKSNHLLLHVNSSMISYYNTQNKICIPYHDNKAQILLHSQFCHSPPKSPKCGHSCLIPVSQTLQICSSCSKTFPQKGHPDYHT